MPIDIVKIKKLEKIIENARGDLVKEFVANETIDQLRIEKSKSLPLLFDLCKKYGIRYIRVHRGELCGCEGIRSEHWPAMWSIAENIGLAGGGGNHDQSQTLYGSWFLEEDYGDWDIIEQRKLSTEESVNKQFCAVVSRFV